MRSSTITLKSFSLFNLSSKTKINQKQLRNLSFLDLKHNIFQLKISMINLSLMQKKTSFYQFSKNFLHNALNKWLSLVQKRPQIISLTQLKNYVGEFLRDDHFFEIYDVFMVYFSQNWYLIFDNLFCLAINESEIIVAFNGHFFLSMSMNCLINTSVGSLTQMSPQLIKYL